MGRIVWGTAVFIVLAAVYLCLAGSVDAVELAAMIVCAGIGTALAVALEAVAKRNFGPLPPLKAIFRSFAALLPEFFAVGRVLIAAAVKGTTRQQGTFVEQPFDPGTDDQRSAGRRALTVIGVSLAPRTFVIRGERTDSLLLHGLPPKPPSSDRQWPA